MWYSSSHIYFPINFTKIKYFRCLAIGKRHTGSVGSVSFFQTTQFWSVSASQDTCLKLWEIPKSINSSDKKKVEEAMDTGDEPISLQCKQTAIAHQKEINNVSVSPNDKIVATASQDKTVKLWTCDTLELLGVLKGHKRGVWSVR